MSMFLTVLTTALLTLLPIVNPVGALATYAGLTAGYDRSEVRRQAIRTGINVFVILAVFAILGSLILRVFGLSLPAIQIAGGFVVAHSGLGMLNPKSPLSKKEHEHAKEKDDISFTPMALPLVAGPGAIGQVIGLAARYPGVVAHGALVMAILVIAACIAALLLWGTPLVDKLGPTGIGALIRVIGFLILCIGVELMIHGVVTLHL
ncbi:MarC family protein [Bifidobacterium psychraerophilum]|uniref:MarC family protein n=1 Tax=Bifidobacterium psychraerophilum TaxID=218140 RepID=UPI0039E7EAE7